MKSRNIQGLFTILTAILIVIIGASGLFAQGKGRGGGNRDGGSPARDPYIGPPIAREQPQRKQQVYQPQPQREQRQQQPRYERPQIQRQQPSPGWQNQGWQHQKQVRVEQPRFERQQIQRQQPNAGGQNRGWQHQKQVRVDQTQRPQPNAGWQNRGWQKPDRVRIEQPQIRGERGRDNKDFSQQARREDRGGYERRAQTTVPWSNAWPNNYGYERSREVHARNAIRKALKDEEKALRRDLRDDRTFTAAHMPDYRYSRSYYENRDGWRENVLRSIAVNALASNANYYADYYPQYEPVYYGIPYDPAYYSGNYYVAYPRYQSYTVPYYDYYSPFGPVYVTQYAGDPYYPAIYSNDFPYAYFMDTSSGGSFVRQLFARLLALGYDQGYSDGIAARRVGYDDRYYYDPYAYENVMYDPYSYSLGENRRCLSEGYELGYRDALYGRREYDPYRYGEVDLVSVLIGNSLEIL